MRKRCHHFHGGAKPRVEKNAALLTLPASMAAGMMVTAVRIYASKRKDRSHADYDCRALPFRRQRKGSRQ